MRPKRRARLGALLLPFAAGVVPLGPLAAQEERDWPAIMRAVAAAAEPGPEHALLARLEGHWRQTFTYHPHDGRATITFTGSNENRMVLGGRFLLSESRLEGTDFHQESITLFGFDRRHGRYTVVTFASDGTYYVTAAGPPPSAGDPIVMAGEDDEPIIGHTQLYDIELSVEGPDRYTTAIIFRDELHTRGGPPHRMVETTHERVRDDR